MAFKIQTPAEIWKDYNPTKEPLHVDCNFETLEINRARTLKDYVFLGETATDGEIRVYCRVLTPIERRGVIVFVEDYISRNNSKLIDKLVEAGYAVFVPDYCDRLNSGTKFTPQTAYGKISASKDRLVRMQEQAQDTAQFLYEKLIKRTLTFAKSLYPTDPLLLFGAGQAAELATVVCGSDMRVNGLVLLNGGFYREYLNRNRFDETQQGMMDDHEVSWMSGVASAAYARYITCPVLVLSTTNSTRFDADRMQMIQTMLKNAQVLAYHTVGAVETIAEDGFKTLQFWLHCFANKIAPPMQPEVKIRLEDSALSVYVKADNVEKIASVNIFYAFDEYNHRYRNWQMIPAKSISNAGEYLASIPSAAFHVALFAMAEVRYAEGGTLSSYINFLEAKTAEADDCLPGRLVLNGAEGAKHFCLETDENLLTEHTMQELVTPIGIKGVTASDGSLVTFVLNEARFADESAILQINFYTPIGKQVNLKALAVLEDGTEDEYGAQIQVLGASEVFTAVKLSAEMFKNVELMPMSSWNTVKALMIETKGAVIGNILFI